MKTRLRLIIRGELNLPGVPFRQIMRDVAKRNGVTGWVRFLSDGAAEAVLEGEEAGVDAVLRFAYAGTQGTKVREVVVIKEEYKGEFADFKAI